MKNELLARAISELDDDLLEEAHQPIQKKKHPITHLQSWAALAACFVVLVASLMPLRSKDDIGVFVNGVNMMAENSVEIPLFTSTQHRQTARTEIPLNILDAGSSVTLAADDGSVLLHTDGTEHRELIASGGTEIIWVVNTLMQDSFELRLVYDDQIITITAEVSQTKGCMIVTVRYGP